MLEVFHHAFVFHEHSHLRRALQIRFSGVFEQSIPCILAWPADRAQNDLRLAADLGLLAACFLLTGGFRFIPCALAERLPASFRPPLSDCPSARAQAGVLNLIFLVLTDPLTPFNKFFYGHVTASLIYPSAHQLHIPLVVPFLVVYTVYACVSLNMPCPTLEGQRQSTYGAAVFLFFKQIADVCDVNIEVLTSIATF